MFLYFKPGEEFILDFMAGQQNQALTYNAVGYSLNAQAPPGFTVDHNRVRIGEGRATFELAVEAVKQWKIFNLPWTELYFKNTRLEPGRTVALLIRHFGFWSLNAARIVYSIDRQPGPIEKFGFAYGTLPEHGEEGEERFSVEFHEADQSVWYDLYAFSRPHNWAAKAGYPLSRYLQKSFAAGSKQAMAKAVKINKTPPAPDPA